MAYITADFRAQSDMIKTDPPFQSWEAISAKMLCACCFSVEGCAETIHRAPTCCGKKPTKISSLYINIAYGAALSLHTKDVPYNTSRSFHTQRCRRFHLLAYGNCFSEPKHHFGQVSPRTISTGRGESYARDAYKHRSRVYSALLDRWTGTERMGDSKGVPGA